MIEETIFANALEKSTPTEREAYLEQACAGNPTLRHRVEALLQAHEQSGDLLDPTAGGSDATVDHVGATPPGPTATALAPPARPCAEEPGSHIGAYKLLQPIGTGGMGAVWLAQQEWPIRRKVALKVIKIGMDTAQVTARFEAERQALALMDHPSIARVFDAGTTDTGRPYFVMELVKGVPITKFCDDAALSPRDRLELFVPVCQAIQHAHQKGIIHRDIKPSNILVTHLDGRPVPKVIDFGIARAMDQNLTERTLVTQFGTVVGTPEYMSPEQAQMSCLDIDTRSDVYALGILLYELLTGSTPLERERLSKAAFTEVLRWVREEEPTKPSTWLSTTKEAASVAARRNTEPERLVKLVRGELDWIVMKCLEKDRTRRYETANALGRDIQRYLAGEPVEAGPPSSVYRLGKFARKHRAALVVAAGFAAVLVVATAISTWQAIRALSAERAARQAEADTRDERDRALRAEGEARTNMVKALEEEKKAQESASEAKAVLGFFEDKVLAAARPEGQEGGLGHEVTLRKAVDAAEPKIPVAFKDQPTVEASIRDTLGMTYYYLGEADLAISQFERCRQLRSAKLGPDHLDTLASMNHLGMAYQAKGRLNEAIALYKETLRLRRLKLGPDHSETLASMNDLATAYFDVRQFDDAIKLHERVLVLRKLTLPPDHSDTLASMNNLAAAYQAVSQFADAIKLHEEALKSLERTLGPDHLDTLASMNNLAAAYRKIGRLDKAIPLHEEVRNRLKRTLPPHHRHALLSSINLAAAYEADGRRADAIPLLEHTIKLANAKPNSDHDDLTLVAMNNLARAYQADHRVDDALSLLKETLKLARAKQGPDHPDTLLTLTLSNLAEASLEARQWGEAEMAARECRRLRGKIQPADWQQFFTTSLLGAALAGQKRYPEAELLLLNAYEGLMAREAKIPVPRKKILAEAGERIVAMYEHWDKGDKAAEWRKNLTDAERSKRVDPERPRDQPK
jgi:serine/threonine protein kinase